MTFGQTLGNCLEGLCVVVTSGRKPLASEATVVNVAEGRDTIPKGTVERSERKRTAAEASNAD
jgi:hypothetical protein